MTLTTDEPLRGRSQGGYGKTRTASSPREGQDSCIERDGRFESLNDVTGQELRLYRKSPSPPRGRTSNNVSGPTVELQAPATSPSCLEGQEHSIDRSSRFESLNDVAGSKKRVFRKSPPPPHRRFSMNTPGPTVALKDSAIASTPPRCFEEDDRLSANPSIDRISRFESLNDLTGRKPRVYRKSPPPPTRRISFSADDSE